VILLEGPLANAGLSALVALVTVGLTEFLIRNRRQSDFHRQAFQQLFSPFLPRIVQWFETETAFRRDHDVSDRISLSELGEEYLTHVRSALAYADAPLFEDFQQLQVSIHFSDFSGYMRQYQFVRSFSQFIDSMLHSSKYSRMLSRTQARRYRSLSRQLRLWHVIARSAGGAGAANAVFMWKWRIDLDLLDGRVYSKVERMLDSPNSDILKAVRLLTSDAEVLSNIGWHVKHQNETRKEATEPEGPSPHMDVDANRET